MSEAVVTRLADAVRRRDFGTPVEVLPLPGRQVAFVAITPADWPPSSEAAAALDFSQPDNSGYLALLEDI